MNGLHYARERNFWDKKGKNAYVSLSAFDQQRILNWIDRSTEEKHCLDLGGGSGMTARMLKATGVPFLACLDISREMLKHSGQASVQADAVELPFTECAFDLIVAAAFLHHVPGREGAVLRECARILKPGGRIVGYDPSALCVQNRVFMGDGRMRLASFSPDERPIDPHAMHDRLEGEGFHGVSSKLFSFRSERLTSFEVVQRFVLNPLSRGPARNWFQRWFFWSAIRD